MDQLIAESAPEESLTAGRAFSQTTLWAEELQAHTHEIIS